MKKFLSKTPACSTKICGDKYEAFARRYLESAGLIFVAANVACRAGEIDLIMRDQQTWVFVEVRYRRNASFDTSSCRFDVLAITGSQLEWLRDAFNAE